MPIIKSAKKQMKVSRVKRVRNYQMRDKLKDAIKAVEEAAKGGNAADAQKALTVAYKVIDTAAKKNIIHDRNADRKKSRMARLVANIGEKKAAPVKKATPKKEVKSEKKEEKKEEKETADKE